MNNIQIQQIFAQANNDLPIVGNIFFNALYNVKGVLGAIVNSNFVSHIFGNGVKVSNQGRVAFTFKFYYQNNNAILSLRKVHDVLLFETQCVTAAMGYGVKWHMRVKINPANQLVMVALIA